MSETESLDKPNQKDRLREDVRVQASEITATAIAGSAITEAGVRLNLSVGIQYIDSWLRGVGAAAINNLMEDAATAEISRAQLWQWIRHGATTADGQTIDAALYTRLRDEEVAKLGGSGTGRVAEAAKIMDDLVLADGFTDFLTLPAYPLLP